MRFGEIAPGVSVSPVQSPTLAQSVLFEVAPLCINCVLEVPLTNVQLSPGLPVIFPTGVTVLLKCLDVAPLVPADCELNTGEVLALVFKRATPAVEPVFNLKVSVVPSILTSVAEAPRDPAEAVRDRRIRWCFYFSSEKIS